MIPRFKFSLIDLRRALKAAKDAGLTVTGYNITAAGDLVVMTGGTTGSEPAAPIKSAA